jgi:hypothetical protein
VGSAQREFLSTSDYVFLQRESCPNEDSELEDMIKPEVYIDDLEKYVGIELESYLNGAGGSWSERIQLAMKSNGKLFNDSVKANCKNKVKDAVLKYDISQALTVDGLSAAEKALKALLRKLESH